MLSSLTPGQDLTSSEIFTGGGFRGLSMAANCPIQSKVIISIGEKTRYQQNDQ